MAKLRNVIEGALRFLFCTACFSEVPGICQECKNWLIFGSRPGQSKE